MKKGQQRRSCIAQGTPIGNFTVQKLLGSGAQAEVYLAIDTALRRKVALKIFSTLPVNHEKNFLSEGRMIASLDHPNIVRVYQIGKQQKMHFIAFEFVAGGSLEDLVLRAGPLSPKRAAKYALAMADGLSNAHDADIVHRDIKPQNLLLTSSGVLKIADFGLAQDLGASAGDSPIGTPKYMAPEIWQNQPATMRTDLYSAGGCLHFMLTGDAPFPSQNLAQVRDAHLYRAVSIPSNVPDELASIIHSCMQKDTIQRMSSANQLRRALRDYIGHMPGRRLGTRPLPAAPEPEKQDTFLEGFVGNPHIMAAAIYSTDRSRLTNYSKIAQKWSALDTFYKESIAVARRSSPTETLKIAHFAFTAGQVHLLQSASHGLSIIAITDSEFPSADLDKHKLAVLMNIALLKFKQEHS